MTVEEFLDWALAQDEGRYELVDGEIVAMAPERVNHSRGKAAAFTALRAAISHGGVACEAFVDSLAVRIDDRTSFVPDALVNCGEVLTDEMMIASNPVVVVEVLSPSSRNIDKATKLVGYFKVPGLVHYLIVDVVRRVITHHRRELGSSIHTTLIHKGPITLDPPGIVIVAEDLLG